MKKIALLFVILFFGYFLYRTLTASFFFLKRDRINFVVYGSHTGIYSIGLTDDTNYFIPFDADRTIHLPGGYGDYRVGAIGKLSNLDKNPELYKKAFSLAIGTFVDIYFYPRTNDIYYHTDMPNFFYPSPKEIVMDNSNANLFERIYIAYLLLTNPRNHFKTLRFETTEGFYNDYQGNFYSKIFRNENSNAQIVYSDSYKNGLFLSYILEGTGIHVADISSVEEARQSTEIRSPCRIVESTKSHQFSETTKSIAAYFGCETVFGHSDAYDILILLGSLEKSWKI